MSWFCIGALIPIYIEYTSQPTSPAKMETQKIPKYWPIEVNAIRALQNLIFVVRYRPVSRNRNYLGVGATATCSLCSNQDSLGCLQSIVVGHVQVASEN